MKTEAMPILQLPSAPRERGRAHGEALREKIGIILDQWRATTRLQAGMSFGETIDIFLKETKFVDQIRTHMPKLLEEIDGIAEGAGCDPRFVLAFQFGDEARWFFRDRFESANSPNGDNCSSLGARGDDLRPTIIAENVDVGGWADSFQTVLRFREAEGDAETLIFTVAGMLAMNGVNGRGLAVCCNTLLQLDPSPSGLPVAAIVRGVLSSRDFESASAFARTAQHASGQNYLIGGRRGVVNVESCGAGSSVFQLDGRDDRVIHTNHPLANEALSQFERQRALAGDDAYNVSSRRRFRSLSARFGAAFGPSSVEEVKNVLRARDDALFPVCLEAEDRASEAMTIASTIFELGDSVRMHIAAGPPSVADYLVLEAGAA